VSSDRLRFDFTHFQSLTQDEISKVEAIVNENIAKAFPVVTNVMDLEEAKKTGAMALFGEKYSDKVRVVRMGDFSTELCGGTHVANTSNIMLFKIISETGIAAGVRRIEALTGKGVINHYAELENMIHEAAKAAKTEPMQLIKKIAAMNEEMKSLQSENEKLKNKLAKESLGDVLSDVQQIKDVKFLATKLTDVDMNSLRTLGDQLKEKIGSGVILLASSQGTDKVNIIAMVTDDVIAKGAHAGNLIKAIASIVGGGGGGRPNMAQAGGKNPAGIDEMLTKASEVLSSQL
jgi:alanyl-tRNA synthetase